MTNLKLFLQIRIILFLDSAHTKYDSLLDRLLQNSHSCFLVNLSLMVAGPDSFARKKLNEMYHVADEMDKLKSILKG